MSPWVALHITAGAVALLAGATSMAAQKGRRVHRRAGQVFLVSMLMMASTSIYLALIKDEPDNVIVGALTFYLVASGWLTLRITQTRNLIDALTLAAITAIGGTAVLFGWEATVNGTGVKNDIPAASFFLSAAIAAAFACSDAKRLWLGKQTGKPRLVRHAWRMCLAMFIATLSFFFGQAHLFPELIRASYVNWAPIVLVVGVTVHWLLRFRSSAS